MFRQGLLLVAVLGSGVLAGYYLLRAAAPDRPDPDTAAPTDTSEIARLQQQLALAEEERVWLDERVAALEAVIGELRTDAAITTGKPTAEANQTAASAPTQRTLRTSVEALIAAGIPVEQATWIQARLDEYDLKQLYLQDRASREGWLKTPRYHKERRQYRNAFQELRPEIGDDAYDRMLYTLGRANRVMVRDIMQNSPGEQYGLRANDRIIEYDGQRVFTSQELTTLIAGGTAGEQVLVRVQREGQQFDFYLPRGPIGVRLASSRELP
jgi:hypothetical protein